MAIRTTVEIPKRLHDLLRREAERSGSSVRSLMIRAVERTYSESGKSAYVTGPLVAGPGKLGPKFPADQNPHELVYS